jgi:hypothetical protein
VVLYEGLERMRVAAAAGNVKLAAPDIKAELL